MKNIVLAYDGSDGAKRALERTAELANGAAVTVISAVDVMPRSGRDVSNVDRIEASQAALAEARSFLDAKGIKPQAVELHATDIGHAIAEQADEDGADLIVVGTGEKTTAERLFLGSVSSKVVHEAGCDVLVVR
jgi:nucleotide-binding universal stress UspA family protein